MSEALPTQPALLQQREALEKATMQRITELGTMIDAQRKDSARLIKAYQVELDQLRVRRPRKKAAEKKK